MICHFMKTVQMFAMQANVSAHLPVIKIKGLSLTSFPIFLISVFVNTAAASCVFVHTRLALTLRHGCIVQVISN